MSDICPPPFFFFFSEEKYMGLEIHFKQRETIWLNVSRKQDSKFHANCLQWQQFAWNFKTYFLGKIRKILKISDIGLDKSEYQVNCFLISHRKHMLWVLIRSALAMHCQGTSNEYSQYTFSSRNKKNIDTFWLKKNALWRAIYHLLKLLPRILLTLVLLNPDMPCLSKQCKSRSVEKANWSRSALFPFSM